MTPFSKWLPAKWNCDIVYNSAARIDRNNIFQKWGHILVTWQAAIFPQLHGQVSMTLLTTRFVVCHQLLFEVQQSLRTNLSWYITIIITISQDHTARLSQVIWWMKSGTQMPLCWERCSVLQGHNYLLESDDGITINRDIWAVFGSGRDIISVLPCIGLMQRRPLNTSDPKECGQDMCAVTDTSSYIHSLRHRVVKDVEEVLSNCYIRQKPSKIHGTFLLWWMRKSVEAAHAAIPKEKCGDTNCAIILNWNVDLSLPIYYNWAYMYLKWLLDVNEHYLWQTTSSVEGHWFLPMWL